MDYATALEIVTWTAREFHHVKVTQLMPNVGWSTPFSRQEVEEAIAFMRARRAPRKTGFGHPYTPSQAA